jgi:hypothetical protein
MERGLASALAHFEFNKLKRDPKNRNDGILFISNFCGVSEVKWSETYQEVTEPLQNGS